MMNVSKEVLKNFKDETYEEVKSSMTYSPAGDGYGTDHNFIDFNYKSEELDLEELIEELEKLKGVVK